MEKKFCGVGKFLLIFYFYLVILNRLSFFASVAQGAEQLICNQWVGGSIPFAGFKE